jgi:hypothetical protein
MQTRPAHPARVLVKEGGVLVCVRRQTEAWLQGEACRTDHGKWEVKSLSVKRSRDPPEIP